MRAFLAYGAASAALLAVLVLLLSSPIIWPQLTEPPLRGPAVAELSGSTLRQALEVYSLDG